MARAIAEETNSLSVFWLKKQGNFPVNGGSLYSGITWRYRISGRENNMNFIVTTERSEADNIRLLYNVRNIWTGEKNDMDFKIPLTTTPCNYGGVRYWFLCALYKNGIYCGRRVGVIYSIDKWFGCRHCANIGYQAQFEGGRLRITSVSELEVEKAYNKIKRKYYNSQPTRRYRRYLRLREKMDNSWLKFGMHFGINSK